jgi:hypothetical protein
VLTELADKIQPEVLRRENLPRFPPGDPRNLRAAHRPDDDDPDVAPRSSEGGPAIETVRRKGSPKKTKRKVIAR